MDLVSYLYRKLNDEMRMVYITATQPRNKIRLDPLDPEDLNVDLSLVQAWSSNNSELYNLLLQNGMAEFICNRQFLEGFYTHLQFMHASISILAPSTLRLRNLRVLNLFHNNLLVIENIPSSCVQLYLDFNQISQVKLGTEQSNVQLLSLSYNFLNCREVAKLLSKMKHLRCLNLAANHIVDIRRFSDSLKKCTKLKMLTAKGNPISMLAIYWDYLTTENTLDFFDNEKYVKPEPPKPPKKEEKPVQKKQDKKEAKKDSKKAGKVEEKPPEPESEPEPIIEEKPKVLAEEDFTISHLQLSIGVFENFTGNSYDQSLFPAEEAEPSKTQTSYWLQAEYLGKKVSEKERKIPLQRATVNEETNLLNFQFSVQQQFQVSVENLQKLKQGVSIYVWKEEPLVNIDSETGEQKVSIDVQGKVKFVQECIGGCYLNLIQILPLRVKEINKNIGLFVKEAVMSPLFKRPYENEKELIQKHRAQFDAKLAQEFEKKRKEKQEEEAAKAQKKGGKDSKKGAEKKGAKKDSKEPQADKKLVEKSKLEPDSREYCYLEGGRMYKRREESVEVRGKVW